MSTYRLCSPDDGPRIGALLRRCNDPNVEPHGIELDWNKSFENWIIAEDDNGDLVGCVAFATALPIGFAENMSVAPELPHLARARVIIRLTQMVHIVLRERGASALVYLVPDGHAGWRDALIERGAKVAARGAVLVRGL